jgi:hypothetical protein
MAVVFFLYTVIGFPSLLFAGASIFGNSSSPIVEAFLYSSISPIFGLPMIIFFVELQQWLRKRRARITAA